MRTDPRFVGRDEELDSFEQMLQDPWGDSRLKFIWGPGGIGKTWLIKEMLKRVQKHTRGYKVPESVIDMYATRNRHLEGVIESIIEQLGLSKDTLNEYQKEKERLLQARQQIGYATQGIEARLRALMAAFRQELSQFVRQQPVVLAFDTFEHVQDTAIGRWILDDQGLQMPGLLCLIASRKPNPHNPEQHPLNALDQQRALNFYRHYAPSFWSDELSEQEIAYILRLNERVQGNPLLLGLALLWLDNSGLSEEDWQILSLPEFERRITSRFNPSNISRQGGLFSGVDANWQYPLCQTIICIAYLNRRFTRHLLTQLIQGGYVYTAGVSEIEAITTLWQLLNNKLPDFFYIKERPEGEIQLHDKLAEMFRIHILPEAFNDPIGQRVRALADAVVTWYDDLIAKTEHPSQKAILQTEKLAYALRMDVIVDTSLPERRDTDEAKRLKRLLPPDFAKAKTLLDEYRQAHSDVLNRLLISEVNPLIVSHFPQVDQYELNKLLGEMASDIYLLKESSDYWHGAFIVAQTVNDLPGQIRALRWEANNTWQWDTPKAFGLLHQAWEMCKDVPAWYPEIYYTMGYIHRRRHNLVEAVELYELAKTSAEEHDDAKLMTPTILNDLGYALLLTGQYDRAEAHIKMAVVLRERNRDKAYKWLLSLQEQGVEGKELQDAQLAWRDALRKLGMSYNTLGQLARQDPNDLAGATGYYAEALAIFNELNDFYWQAQTLQARGDAHRRLALELFYKERHGTSQAYHDFAETDIELSLGSCQFHGYMDLLPIAYRRKGRLLHDQALRTPDDANEQVRLMKEALQQFEAAIAAAQQTGNVMEELESRTEIAFLTDDFIRAYRQQRSGKPLTPGQQQEVEAYLTQFRQGIAKHEKDDPRVYQYPVFADLLKIEEGAFHYEMGDYDISLRLYLDGFTGLASDPGYGSARCRAHIGHLFSNIRKLSDPDLKQTWYDKFLKTWRTSPMKDKSGRTVAHVHPKIIEQFELHKMFE